MSFDNYKIGFILFIVTICPKDLVAQEWSSRITLIEKHLVDGNKIIKEPQKSISFEAFNNDFNVGSFNTTSENLSFGMNLLLEEEPIKTGFSLNDLFTYSFGLKYTMDVFDFSINFENFFNLNTNDLCIEPVLVSNDQFIDQVLNEYDTSYLIAVSVNYSF